VTIYKVKIEGTKPLLMHNPESMISDRPKRRRGEHPDPREEAEVALYKNESGEICIPAFNVKACIREAGRNYKVAGRKSTFAAMIRAGLEISPSMIPVIHNGWTIDLRSVVIQRSRILRARPRFNVWELEFEIRNLDADVIHADTLKRIIEDAGRFNGLGDFRPEFGLFKLVKFEVNQST